ncbi:MAG: Lrp/AsnC family transcriptional regulator [Pseudomonadota bacterium]|nr:Lrp/AsnC family transcriptional regulator [Pseudomonadota bacterium]
MDPIDRSILSLLQKDASLPIAEIAERVGLSQTPCWKRIQKLEASGIIKSRVALLNSKKLNLGLTVFVQLRTDKHDEVWLTKFSNAVRDMPEIVEVYRMAGDIDYLLRVVVKDTDSYDRFYKDLIKKISIHDVSSSFAMEEIKYTTSLPIEKIRAA